MAHVFVGWGVWRGVWGGDVVWGGVFVKSEWDLCAGVSLEWGGVSVGGLGMCTLYVYLTRRQIWFLSNCTAKSAHFH